MIKYTVTELWAWDRHKSLPTDRRTDRSIAWYYDKGILYRRTIHSSR